MAILSRIVKVEYPCYNESCNVEVQAESLSDAEFKKKLSCAADKFVDYSDALVEKIRDDYGYNAGGFCAYLSELYGWRCTLCGEPPFSIKFPD